VLLKQMNDAYSTNLKRTFTHNHSSPIPVLPKVCPCQFKQQKSLQISSEECIHHWPHSGLQPRCLPLPVQGHIHQMGRQGSRNERYRRSADQQRCPYKLGWPVTEPRVGSRLPWRWSCHFFLVRWQSLVAGSTSLQFRQC
jgi:hypothetical protein